MEDDEIIKLIKSAEWLTQDEEDYWLGLLPNLEKNNKIEVYRMFEQNLKDYQALKEK